MNETIQNITEKLDSLETKISKFEASRYRSLAITSAEQAGLWLSAIESEEDRRRKALVCTNIEQAELWLLKFNFINK